jgi:hypothetical protein
MIRNMERYRLDNCPLGQSHDRVAPLIEPQVRDIKEGPTDPVVVGAVLSLE